MFERRQYSLRALQYTYLTLVDRTERRTGVFYDCLNKILYMLLIGFFSKLNVIGRDGRTGKFLCAYKVCSLVE